MSPSQRPRPGRRRTVRVLEVLSPTGPWRYWLLLLVCLILLHQSTALERDGQRRAARQGALLIDPRPTPTPRRLSKRQNDPSSSLSSSSAGAATASAIFVGTSTLSVPSSNGSVSSTINSGTSSTNSGASSLTPSALPQPFDASLGNNFTSSTCPAFFEKFLGDTAFESCLPLSLLLQTSNAFFTASRSFPRITQVLDATCNVNFPQCTSLMTSYANQLRSQSACGADYALQNPQVLQAYVGFISYPLLYRAGCLKDASTGNYCFANAITNTSTLTNSYVYYLPLGLALPGSSTPGCTTCLQDTMAVFSTQASNRSQPLNGVYVQAAKQIDIGCGPSFVNATVAVSSDAARFAGRFSVVAGSLALVGTTVMALLV